MNNTTHIPVFDWDKGLYVWSGSREALSQDECDELNLNPMPTATHTEDVTKLPDLDVWREMAWTDLAEYTEYDEDEFPSAIFATAPLETEAERRWGKTALIRANDTLSAARFTQEDMLRLYDKHGALFMQLVRGELTQDEFYARYASN